MKDNVEGVGMARMRAMNDSRWMLVLRLIELGRMRKKQCGGRYREGGDYAGYNHNFRC